MRAPSVRRRRERRVVITLRHRGRPLTLTTGLGRPIGRRMTRGEHRVATSTLICQRVNVASDVFDESRPMSEHGPIGPKADLHVRNMVGEAGFEPTTTSPQGRAGVVTTCRAVPVMHKSPRLGTVRDAPQRPSSPQQPPKKPRSARTGWPHDAGWPNGVKSRVIRVDVSTIVSAASSTEAVATCFRSPQANECLR